MTRKKIKKNVGGFFIKFKPEWKPFFLFGLISSGIHIINPKSRAVESWCPGASSIKNFSVWWLIYSLVK